MNAKEFVEVFSAKVIHEVEDRAADHFSHNQIAAPQARAYYDFTDLNTGDILHRAVWQQYAVVVELTDTYYAGCTPEAAIAALAGGADYYFKTIRFDQGDILVWRIRPELTANDLEVSNDFDGKTIISRVKLYFRAAAIPEDVYVRWRASQDSLDALSATPDF